MDYFKHENAIVENGATIGKNSKIWAFAHILGGAEVGSNCNICDHTFIENDVVIGNNVTIKCGVYLWDGVRIADDVFIGPNVTFTNDKFPRSKQYPEEFACTIIEQGVSIGANATILPVKIGEYAMVGAGAVVTKNVPSYAIVVGNPARVVNYVDSKKLILPTSTDKTSNELNHIVSRTGVKLYKLPTFTDMRGDLIAIEWAKRNIPFDVQRVFIVYNVPTGNIRGEHAHKKCHQFLFAVHGSVNVVCDDGMHREEFVLDNPSIGLHIIPGVWGIQYKYSKDAVLIVMASDVYDPADYIRDYHTFLEYKKVSK